MTANGAALLRGAPRHGERIRLEQIDGANVLVDERGLSTALNDTAFALWEACDGETSVDELIGAICTLFSGPREQIESDVIAALERLTRIGLLIWDI